MNSRKSIAPEASLSKAKNARFNARASLISFDALAAIPPRAARPHASRPVHQPTGGQPRPPSALLLTCDLAASSPRPRCAAHGRWREMWCAHRWIHCAAASRPRSCGASAPDWLRTGSATRSTASTPLRTRLEAPSRRLSVRSTSKVRALPAHAGAPPAHQLSQAQRRWSVLPRAAEACAPRLRRRLTGAAHSEPRPSSCDHHLEQARSLSPHAHRTRAISLHATTSPALLHMTVRQRCVCRGQGQRVRAGAQLDVRRRRRVVT